MQVMTEQLARDLQALWGHIMRTSSGEFLRVAAESDLNLSQLKTIFHVGGSGGGTVKALATELALSEAAASRAVEGLVQRGLVERRESPQDRRNRLLSLTPQGQAVRDRALSARLAGLVEFVETLEPAERRALADALAPIIQRICS